MTDLTASVERDVLLDAIPKLIEKRRQRLAEADKAHEDTSDRLIQERMAKKRLWGLLPPYTRAEAERELGQWDGYGYFQLGECVRDINRATEALAHAEDLLQSVNSQDVSQIRLGQDDILQLRPYLRD